MVEQKLAIIGEAFASGSSVASTIGRHEISSGQLYGITLSVVPRATGCLEILQRCSPLSGFNALERNLGDTLACPGVAPQARAADLRMSPTSLRDVLPAIVG